MGDKIGVYIASPLGFADTTRDYLQKIHGVIEKHGFEVLDPWGEDYKADFEEAKKTAPDHEGWIARLRLVNSKIGRRNVELINQAVALVAVLDGVDVDSGTAAEVGFAYAHGKAILGLRTDFRLSADNQGSTVNLQVEYFIVHSWTGGQVTRTLEELDKSLGILKGYLEFQEEERRGY